MAGEPSPTDAAAAPSRSIVLRAPHGDVDWTIIELQGSIEPRSGVTSLDGIEFGTLVHEVRAGKENIKSVCMCS